MFQNWLLVTWEVELQATPLASLSQAVTDQFTLLQLSATSSFFSLPFLVKNCENQYAPQSQDVQYDERKK